MVETTTYLCFPNMLLMPLLYAMLFPITPAIFLDEGQDVGSPLRVAQCRATCLERFSNDGPRGESMCLQGPDCFMCWENCELLQSNFQVWGAMCDEREICFPGCQEACRFHSEISTAVQQTQPVIYTKDEAVIRVDGGTAHWPRPSTPEPTTPLVYVVMRRSSAGPWRQIIQTIDLRTRVPVGCEHGDATLRILVVDPDGLLTIYSPHRSKHAKKGKSINTEVRAKNRSSPMTPTKWQVHELSLIHQKVLVIAEISWAAKASRGVYLVTWEINGGGLKGNLFTDSTCVTLSLWPDTVYHIQVELVSRYPGVPNLKSQMLDLDTGRAMQVSTETDGELKLADDGMVSDEDDAELQESFAEFVETEHADVVLVPFKEMLTGALTAMFFFAAVLVGMFVRLQCANTHSQKISEEPTNAAVPTLVNTGERSTICGMSSHSSTSGRLSREVTV